MHSAKFSKNGNALQRANVSVTNKSIVVVLCSRNCYRECPNNVAFALSNLLGELLTDESETKNPMCYVPIQCDDQAKGKQKMREQKEQWVIAKHVERMFIGIAQIPLEGKIPFRGCAECAEGSI